MRRPLLLTAGALALAAAIVPPASADDTTVTFSITAAGLTVSVPGSVNIGSVASGATSISERIGPVTVNDLRGVLAGSWTASVIATDFTTGGATGPETVPNINVTYAPGTATTTTGVGVFTPGPGGIVNVPRTAFTGTALVGNNSATWNPTLTVTIPSGTVAGIYSGTVTHSVA